METTRWEQYGRSSGNEKCRDCMVHCGHEPSAVDATFASLARLPRHRRRHRDRPAVAGMSDDEKSLEGWTPEIPDGAALAEVLERAFDYRGDVTLDLDDGRRIEGYLFNRNRDVAEPFVQMFASGETAPSTIPYARIRAVRFTGRDTAAGNSYAAWLAATAGGQGSLGPLSGRA